MVHWQLHCLPSPFYLWLGHQHLVHVPNGTGSCTQTTTGNGVNCVPSAYNTGVCYPIGVTGSTTKGAIGGYNQVGCGSASSGWAGGMVTYPSTDSKCTAANAVSATLFYTGCNNGQTVGTCTGAALPTLNGLNDNVQNFADNNVCSSAARKPVQQVIKDGACIDSTIIACNTTGNTVIRTSYTVTDGTCGGAVVSTMTVTNKVCYATSTTTSLLATCVPAPGPSAAASTSVSIVTMLVATFLALVARSL